VKLLFDTHTFIWWDGDPDRLSARTLALLEDPSHTLLFSVVSAWEIQIKLQLGKLRLDMPLQEVVEGQQQSNGVQLLPVILPHVLALEGLPAHHKDPFDRLLIAQAIQEGAALVSSDPVFDRYPVNLIR
jgi:PIN domain nuclease of toxin-antitoxin system